jgi:nucleoside recognition membrane protein YjiH
MHTKAIVFILLQLFLYGIMHTNIFHDVSSFIVNFIPNFQVVYYVSQKHKEGNRIHVRTATFVENR